MNIYKAHNKNKKHKFTIAIKSIKVSSWLKQIVLISPKLNALYRLQNGVHICFIMSPGKMIFAVLELRLSPLQ